VPDQRGHGHSTRRPADLSRRAFIDDVVAVVDALAGAAPVTLVGQSMGAHTAMLVAAARPDLVRRLVLAEGGVGGPGADDYPARLGAWFASWPAPFADEAAAAAWLGGTPIARAWAADLERRADGWWPRFDADVLEAAIRPVAARACWAEWRQVAAPTLLVAGEHGKLDPAEVARMRELRPETEYVVIPGAGHDLHLDRPEAWLTALRGFLARRPAVSGD
jgi:pimeloyl-ACP methyl ester carboxylesterase